MKNIILILAMVVFMAFWVWSVFVWIGAGIVLFRML